MDYVVKAGSVGDAVYVRVTADLDVLEGDRVGIIHCDDASLTVRYYLAAANAGDEGTERSQAYRFSGSNSAEIAQFFLTDGEAVRVYEYSPQPKPSSLSNPRSLAEMTDRRIEQWVNPKNERVGFRIREWLTRAFVGDREQILSRFYKYYEPDISLNDGMSIILPSEFPGFDPSPRKSLIPFGADSYQGTTWTVFRDDAEYCLRNIKRAGFFRGQIVFWSADLVRIHYPAGTATDSFLPWNELLDSSWKPIHYVRSFSLLSISDDPYSDPYSDPYLMSSDGISDEDAAPCDCEDCADCPYCPECDECPYCPDCPECEECPECPTAPEPLEAVSSGTTLTITFNKALVEGTSWTANYFRWWRGNTRYIAGAIETVGNQVILSSPTISAQTHSNDCQFNPSAGDYQITGVNGVAVYSFSGFPITLA